MNRIKLALLILGLGLIVFAGIRFFSKPEPVRDKGPELEDSIRRSIRSERIRKLNQRFIRVQNSIKKAKAAGKDVSELERDWNRAAEIGQKGLYDLADQMLETIELRLPPEPTAR